MRNRNRSVLSIAKVGGNISGEIRLDGSKSISNRVLIIQALCEKNFEIKKISSSDDTQSLKKMLDRKRGVLDAGAAGTTFRFSTAYFAFQKGTQILTGSERMKQRPIGVLVDALRMLGANIEYLEHEGYPPIRISSPTSSTDHEITIPADTSSQFISALLLVAPMLPNGLKLKLKGKIVSTPYIKMTLDIMREFGIKSTWDDEQVITILPQKYISKDFTVEADWSAASYYYALIALADKATIHLRGLFEKSVQGDRVIVELMKKVGVKTIFEENGLTLKKESVKLPETLEFDFIDAPDIAQTLAVVCGGLGIQSTFYGLETLGIKETDRIQALKVELAKVNVLISPFSSKGENDDAFKITGKAAWTDEPVFETYHDHRMAMALAPLALKGDIVIKNPHVVSKSYPNFWKDFFQVLQKTDGTAPKISIS